MAATVTTDGRMIWNGRIAVATGPREAVYVVPLRTGRMIYDTLSQNVQVVFDTTFDQTILAPFHINNIHDIVEHPDNDAACIFEVSNANTCVAFDFKDVRPNEDNSLTPQQRASLLISFLQKLPTFPSVDANEDSSREQVPQEVVPPATVPSALPPSRQVPRKNKKSSKQKKTVTPIIEKTRNQVLNGTDDGDNKDNAVDEHNAKSEGAPKARKVDDKVTNSDSASTPKTNEFVKLKDVEPVMPALLAQAKAASAATRNQAKTVSESTAETDAATVSTVAEESSTRKQRHPKRGADSPPVTGAPKRAKTRSTVVRGLANVGNTCYMNAVLQATFWTEVFQSCLVAVYDFMETNQNVSPEFIEQNMPLIKHLCSLFRNGEDNGDTEQHLKNVLHCVGESFDKFRLYDQEDAHEFLTLMFSRLKNEYDIAKEEVGPNGKDFPPEPVDACFSYGIRRYFTCTTCMRSHANEEANTCFFVDVNDANTQGVRLSDIIQRSLRDEEVDCRCPIKKCGGQKAVMKSYINKIPEVFIVALRRYSFSYGSQNKLHAKIIMEETMKFACEEDINKKGRNSAKGSKTTYSIESLDNDYRMNYNFRNLQATFNGKDVPTRKRTVNNPLRVLDGAELQLSYSNFLNALTNSETGFIKYIEKVLCEHLYTNAEVYAPLMDKPVERFRREIKNCKQGKPLHTTLDLLACASVFQANFWVYDGKTYVKFPPIAPKLAKPMDIFISPDMCESLDQLSANKITYSLNSIVCHEGISSDVGHYEGLIRSPFTKWFVCNDKVIRTINKTSAFHKSANTAYIMFYAKDTLVNS